MKYPEFSVGLEKLRLPVLITDGEGTVLYKNAAAMQRVRLPKRMTKIEPHLYHSPGLPAILGSVRPRLPQRVSIDSGDRIMNAIVSTHGQNKEQYLWIFVPLLQSNPCSTGFTLLEKKLLTYSYEICDIVRCSALLDHKSGDQAPNPICARIDRRIDTILNGIFTRFSDPGEHELHNAYRIAAMLSDTFSRTLTRLGYPVRGDYSALDPEKMKSLFVDAVTLSILLSEVSHIALTSSGQNGISVTFTHNDDKIGMDVVYTGLYPPFYTENCTSFQKYARLSGGSGIEHEILSHICAAAGCAFGFSVSADEIDNIRLHFGFPLVNRPGFHISGTVSDLLFERDSVLYLLSLFE